MKKTLTVCILLMLLAPAFTSAQLRIALIGGPHKSNVIETNEIAGWDTTTKPGYSGRNGMHLGVIIDVSLGNSGRWSLQPGIMYHTKGRNYYHYFDTTLVPGPDTFYVGNKFQPNYIDFPFNLTYRLPLGKKSAFFLSAGPYFSFFYSGKSISESKLYPSFKYEENEQKLETGNEKNKLQTVDLGLNGRAGFELGRMILSGYYSRGLTSFYTAEYEGKFNHEIIGGSIGFWLNKKEKTVSARSNDKDKDGVPDAEDACPETPGTAIARGCPDKDADGIPDKFDKCPDQAGTQLKQGCPVVDTDGDGIENEEDQCPDTPGLKEFNGCPQPEKAEDKNVPEVQPSRDPEVQQEIISKVSLAAREIFFETGSTQISSLSFKALRQVVDILKENKELGLIITGYTDNVGDEEKNRDLSERRANEVKNFLVNLGIAENRLEATGKGEENPIADNSTPEGRKRNRRVELEIVE